MRRLAAVVAILGMSGCTLVVLGAAATSDLHHSSSSRSSDGLGQALLGAVLLDLTTLAALGVIPTSPPAMASPAWTGVRVHPPQGSGAP